MIPVFLGAGGLAAAIDVRLPDDIGHIGQRHEMGGVVDELARGDGCRVIGELRDIGGEEFLQRRGFHLLDGKLGDLVMAHRPPISRVLGIQIGDDLDVQQAAADRRGGRQRELRIGLAAILAQLLPAPLDGDGTESQRKVDGFRRRRDGRPGGLRCLASRPRRR